MTKRIDINTENWQPKRIPVFDALFTAAELANEIHDTLELMTREAKTGTVSAGMVAAADAVLAKAQKEVEE